MLARLLTPQVFLIPTGKPDVKEYSLFLPADSIVKLTRYRNGIRLNGMRMKLSADAEIEILPRCNERPTKPDDSRKIVNANGKTLKPRERKAVAK